VAVGVEVVMCFKGSAADDALQPDISGIDMLEVIVSGINLPGIKASKI
jgi:hypothetical protein